MLFVERLKPPFLIEAGSSQNNGSHLGGGPFHLKIRLICYGLAFYISFPLHMNFPLRTKTETHAGKLEGEISCEMPVPYIIGK